MVAPTLLWLVKLCLIGLAIVVPGSSGKEGMLDRVQEKSTAHSSPLEPNGLAFSLAPGMLPVASAPVPKTTEGPVSSSSPATSVELPPHTMARPPFVAPIASLPAPPPLHFQVPIPSVLPSSPQVVAVDSSPVASPGPVASPPRHSPETSPSVDQSPDRIPSHSSPQNPPADTQWKKNATPPTSAPQSSPAIHSRRHRAIPGHINKSNMSRYKAPISVPILPDPAASPISAPLEPKTDGVPVASPANQTPKALPPSNHSPRKGFVTAEAPTHKAVRQSNNPPGPHFLPPDSPPSLGYYAPAVSPSNSFHKHQGLRNKFNSPHAPAYLASPPSKQQGPISSPSVFPGKKQKQFAPPTNPVLPSKYPGRPQISPAPSPSLATTTSPAETPVISQKVSPSGILSRTPKVPLRPPVQAFPPPPPNEDCAAIICTEPLTNRLPGAPCGCVQPMQVGLCLNVALYTFFPSVPELASEISAGVFMKQSQVRVIGANAASEQPEKTIVLIDLVPIGDRFDTMTAFLTFQRFWHKQVIIKASLFGDYEVLYVNYPGLPPSPPSPPSSIGILDDGPYPANDNNVGLKPLGVAVRKKLPKNALGRGMIAVIVLSASAALVLCSAVAWIFLFKHRDCSTQLSSMSHSLQQSLAKASGSGGLMIGSGLSSASLSYGSSIITYSGSAKTFSTSEIERATNNFDASKILGEGGFGRVYSGVLEDGNQVAVKVLKRDDQQGSREFLAEVEMLSRLHHRNLVKLMGICTEERIRCLVYELIPNGSVESHLHGVDKKLAPLDWDARMKIALGAARGLAYLHEDSSPCVIHRDFKASNILLEHDFMPKVSDFGLARTAMDGTRHISTRVMGTFGYVAPEYAMTGHLLVKSDVYSYGVVLLELLTGRKPVDMSQPPGQENLVSWARPLLTNREEVESIIDPTLGPTAPFDSVVKVAAIASMCVQPEVSNRPFMGEVVQALKLVCNECDETKEVDSRSSTADDDSSIDMAADVGMSSRQLTHPLESHYSVPSYDSDPETERGLSVSEVYSGSAPGRYGHPFGSLRRHSTSSPLRTARSRQLWQKMRRFSHGAVRDHGVMFRFWPASR